jgi:hypothetical protein
MTYTDCGTQVKSEWMPQAMANGLEWSAVIRDDMPDRFNNLYSRKFTANWWLWYVGALLALVYRPKWLRTRKQVAGTD